MNEIYIIKHLNNRKVVSDGFQVKHEAKKERNRLIKDGTICVISRGTEHPRGPSIVDPRCLNTMRTSRKRMKFSGIDDGRT